MLIQHFLVVLVPLITPAFSASSGEDSRYFLLKGRVLSGEDQLIENKPIRNKVKDNNNISMWLAIGLKFCKIESRFLFLAISKEFKFQIDVF